MTLIVLRCPGQISWATGGQDWVDSLQNDEYKMAPVRDKPTVKTVPRAIPNAAGHSGYMPSAWPHSEGGRVRGRTKVFTPGDTEHVSHVVAGSRGGPVVGADSGFDAQGRRTDAKHYGQRPVMVAEAANAADRWSGVLRCVKLTAQLEE